MISSSYRKLAFWVTDVQAKKGFFFLGINHACILERPSFTAWARETHDFTLTIVPPPLAVSSIKNRVQIHVKVIDDISWLSWKFCIDYIVVIIE